MAAQSSYNVTTVAGQGPAQDGTGSSANFNRPLGAVVDSNGNVYVADTTNNKIRKITAAGVVTTFAGSGSAGNFDANGVAASFNGPRGIAIDSAANIYVADSGSRKIRKITPAGDVSTFAGSGGAGSVNGNGTSATFTLPSAIAVDANGNVYVADATYRNIRKITPSRDVTTLAGSGASGTADGNGTSASFRGPTGIAVGLNGNVYVADRAANEIRAIDTSGNVTTFAGSTTSGSTDANGTAASFAFPVGVAVDASGNVYVGDSGNQKIRRITPAGDVTTVAGTGATGSTDAANLSATFNTPSGVTVDASGNVYVADTMNSKIRKIGTDGAVTTLAGSGSDGTSGSLDGSGSSATFGNVDGAVVDTSGNLYVTDTTNHKIRKITAAGVVTTFAGSGGIGAGDGNGTAASFKYPFGLAIDSSNNLYIADTNNHLIRKITPAGDVTTVAGTGAIGSTDATGTAASFNYPFGVAVDSHGNLFVADDNNHKVRKITSAGVVTTFAGSGSAGGTDANGTSSSFTNPTGIAVDASDNIYVSDSGGNKIRKITPAGDVTTLAGSGASGHTDGTGPAALFSNPVGLVVDASGNVFVCDSNNNEIRQITPAGVVTTLAGATTVGNIDGIGSVARFRGLSGITIDSSGNLYIGDTNNHKVRKASPLPIITSALTASGNYNTPFNYSITTVNPSTSYGASGLPSGLTINTGTGVISGSPTQLGSFSVLLSATTAGGTGTATVSLTIARTAATVVLGSLTPTYDGSSKAATAVTTPSGLAVNFTYDGGSAAPSSVGSYAVVATVSDSNYTGSASGTLTIAKGAQVISFNAISGKTYGDAPFTVGATADSSLPVSFNILSGPASLAGNTITITGTGTIVVRASQAGDSNYNPAVDVDQSFTVVKSTAVVTLGGLSATYDGAVKSATATTIPTGLTVNFTYDGGSSAPSASGSYAVVATVSDSNYTGSTSGTLTIAKSAQVISFNVLSGKTYGDTPFAIAATATSNLPVSFSVLSGPATISGNMITLTGSGTVVIRAAQSGNLSFFAGSPVDQSFIVAKANASVSLSGLFFAYDGAAKRATATTSPVGLTVAFTYNGSSTPPSAPGNYAVIATINDVNYSGGTTGTLSIGLIAQSITFAAPVDRLTTAAPFTLSATASSSLPVALSILSGPASVSGNTVTLSGSAGTVVVRATQAGDSTYAAATPVSRSFAVTTPPVTTSLPIISQQPANQSVIVGAAATFSVSASGNPAPGYQWRRNGTALAGQTAASLTTSAVTLSDAGASFDVVVSNDVGSVTSAAATLSVSPAITTSQLYSGSFSLGGTYALALDASGNAVMIGNLSNGRGGFIVRFTVNADGTFFATSTSATASATAFTSAPNSRPAPAATVTLGLRGQIVSGQLVGQIDLTGETFGGTMQSGGPAASIAGSYEAPLLNGLSGSIVLIVLPDGTTMSARTDSNGTVIAAGTVTAAGSFSVQLDATTSLQGSVAGGSLNGQLTTGGTSSPLVGASSTVTHTDRLVNISTRGAGGDNEKIIIAGFVISGSQPKTVLIRAIGPSLAALGVDGAMENPVLTLYSESQIISSNDDWSASANSSDVAAAASRLGAFALTPGSKDAAILITLTPGNYTAQILRAAGTANGVALIEVYDAATNPGAETQRLINLSSRAEVRSGSSILIGGFVVTGNFPKKVLIRGVGPTLSRFSISNPLANPTLRLYQGNNVIASNDDWLTDNATAIDTAGAQVGAFALTNNSRDAALFLTLAPGVYTAQVSSADATTGIALLEIYEVP